jgi:peroxiredoxin
MNLTSLPTNLPIPEEDGGCDHLLNAQIPDISLPNQDDNLLKLSRLDTFRLVLYCYPMTGHPERALPINWDSIPGARGCTSETCSFRDNYDELIKLNAVPIGISTQSIQDQKEMTLRLKIPYDVLSDNNLNFVDQMKLPTFQIGGKVFIKRLTLIVEKSFIKKVFYPIFPPDKHIKEVIEWLKEN